MRPSGHLHSTAIALAIFFTLNQSFTVFEGFLFLSGALLLDGDFFVSKFLFHVANHRNFITHSVVFYLILIFLSFVSHSVFIWLFLGALYHLCFDIFDWGIPLVPFKTSTFVTPHLLQVPAQLDEINFFRTYFSNNIIKLVEIALVLGFIISLLLVPLELVILLLLLEALVVSEFLFQYRKVQRQSYQ